MIENIANELSLLKNEFSKTYSGTSHIQEILPFSPSDKFPIEKNTLDLLHLFAQKNPIYHNFHEEKILDTLCTVYEGDINEYWLNSIKHGSSCQPFYPTWILSAYLMVLAAKKLGYTELIDIGSGDGRIAYCGKIIGLKVHGIEIDDILVELQQNIVSSTKIDFSPNCADALEFDYSMLHLEKPVFFIGGLPQMGGDILATSIIEKVKNISELQKNTGFVFAGSLSQRNLGGNQKSGGWSSLIEKHNLKTIQTIFLPTVWTFDQDVDTPYIYTSFN